MTMHQKVKVLIFFNMPKKGSFEKNSSLTILLSSLGLHLSSLLVKCVEDVACKSSHNNFYKKKMSDSIVHVQCNLHVTCTLCFTTLNRIFSV